MQIRPIQALGANPHISTLGPMFAITNKFSIRFREFE